MQPNSERYRSGLSDAQVDESRRLHGRNIITPPPQTPWWRLYLSKFDDPIIIILLVATAVSLIFGIIHGNFTESVGIICAILIATGVGFWQEYGAKRRFDAMRSDSDFEPVKVRRNGIVVETTKDCLVVGDTVLLNAGDEVPADIRLCEATDMKVSEAAMTGESVAVAKYPLDEPFSGAGFAPNLLLRGTTIEQGFGEGVVEKVGDATEIGATTRQATTEVESKTPLEEQLYRLAGKINTAAFVIGGAMLLILNLMHWSFAFGDNAFVWDWELLLTEVRFLMAAIVVIIVAVPEGLPLSVTLALAFSMKTMARENNLVKKMHACETIGAVNVIFTDKTGTLTQNRMTVVATDCRDENRELLAAVGAIDSTAQWSVGGRIIGNPTEAAILQSLGNERTALLREAYTATDRIPFSSAYKYMVTAARCNATGERAIFIKGAPEIIAQITGDDSFLGAVAEQQARGRRSVAAAMLDGDDFLRIKEQLQRGEMRIGGRYIGSWFIEDPIRTDVPAAIAKCYGAGIDVVMMTGDNIKTATEIARQAGFRDIWAIEARDFWSAIESGKAERNGRAFPNVIARCTPSDKLRILQWAQAQRYVCAMTGDGVNDSPTLNYADVGIAMGSGTSVAKEAADIVLLDDAFPSIATGIKWGRSLYKNIKNFLYLQLSINVSACLTALFAPIVGIEMPFTVTQFLWINLVMDSLAAIALVSEPADESVMDEQPRDRNEFIINRSLACAIFGFGGLVWLLCTVVLWGMHNAAQLQTWGAPRIADALAHIDLTIFFAAYMTVNWWNLFNARVIGKHESIFAHLFRNSKFVAITAFVLVATIAIVQYGGDVFQTHPLSWRVWGVILLATSPVVVVREVWFWLFGNRGNRRR